MVQVEELTYDYTALISDDLFQEWLRYDGTDQATVKPVLLEAAIRSAEDYCNAAFGTKTFAAQFDNVCVGKKYFLPYGNIVSVDAAVRVDGYGNEVALTLNTDYFVNGLKDKFIRIPTERYSTGGNDFIAYKFTYTSGYADPADVNASIKQAILQIAAENFENREDSVLGESVSVFPDSSRIKLNPFRKRVL